MFRSRSPRLYGQIVQTCVFPLFAASYPWSCLLVLSTALLPSLPHFAPPRPADTLRLLLVMGSRCTLADKEGCTPLHWAAIRGHTEGCTVLLQVGAGQAEPS